jgi:hypothetical protein
MVKQPRKYVPPTKGNRLQAIPFDLPSTGPTSAFFVRDFRGSTCRGTG